MKESRDQNQGIEDNIRRIVNDSGWYVAKFDATNYLPSFAYTIGLWQNYNHPELIVFGLTPDTLHAILNVGGDIVKNGGRLTENKKTDELLDKSSAFILEVAPKNIKDYFGYGIAFNKGEFPALQIVWTDRNHQFPWEENYEKEFIYRQPLLDRNSAFKFREEKNLGVITNRHFIEEEQPILYVEHDKEGDWIFLTGDECLSADAKLVCLEDMIKRDNTLNNLFNLDYGESAERKSPQDEWVRSKHKNYSRLFK